MRCRIGFAHASSLRPPLLWPRRPKPLEFSSSKCPPGSDRSGLVAAQGDAAGGSTACLRAPGVKDGTVAGAELPLVVISHARMVRRPLGSWGSCKLVALVSVSTSLSLHCCSGIGGTRGDKRGNQSASRRHTARRARRD